MSKATLIDTKETDNIVLNMTKGYIIMGGPKDQIYGTLDFQTMFVWTSKKKADDFLNKNLFINEDKVVEYSFTDLVRLAQKLGFKFIRFDFQAKGVHPEQKFINYCLDRGGVMDLLATFYSIK